MKFLSAAAALLLAPLVVTATPGSFFGSQDVITAGGDKVKGDNPLSHCASTDGDLLEITSVDLAPNPPKAGQTLKIKAEGVLKERLEKGAYVLLEVKYGLITLLKQQPDLCDQLKNVDLECPLEEGPMVLTKQVDLPAQIPPGRYSVLADVYDKDSNKVTCLRAENIQF